MTYTLLLDTLRNASFGGTYDDISTYLLSANWNAGMANPWDEVAPASQMILTLRNAGGEFDQEALSAELLDIGDFSVWVLGQPAGWNVTGESGGDPEVSEAGATKLHGEGGTGWCNLYTSSGASPVSISQAVLTAGTRYKVTLTIGAVSGTGGIVVKDNTTAVSPVYHAPGVKTVYFTAASNTLKIETVGVANVTFDNVSVKSASRYAGSLVRGTLVRLKFDATVLYEGKITNVIPSLGSHTDRSVQVTVEDAMRQLLRADYQQSLLQNATIDQALDQIFDKAVIAYPYAHNYWMLEVEGSSELETTTTLYEHTATDFDTGSTSLDYIGDNLDRGQGVNAQTIIREMVATEFGGRFYWQPRTGKFVFDSRHRDIMDTTNDASYTVSNFHRVKAQQGNESANVIRVDYEPRAVGDAGTVIWSAPNLPIELERNVPKTVKIRFRPPDDEQASIGALTVIPPVAGLDIIANTVEDGSGLVRSQNIDFSLDAGASEASLVIWTSRNARLFVTTLQLRGTPLLRYPRETKTAQSADSFRDTDYQIEKQVAVTALGDATIAEAGANFLLGKFKDALLRIQQVTRIVSDDSTDLATVLSHTISDRISITDTLSGHDADYFIVGEQHAITGGGRNVHEVTWILKPASREQFWLLEVAGFSELDSTTKLAF